MVRIFIYYSILRQRFPQIFEPRASPRLSQTHQATVTDRKSRQRSAADTTVVGPGPMPPARSPAAPCAAAPAELPTNMAAAPAPHAAATRSRRNGAEVTRRRAPGETGGGRRRRGDEQPPAGDPGAAEAPPAALGSAGRGGRGPRRVGAPSSGVGFGSGRTGPG